MGERGTVTVTSVQPRQRQPFHHRTLVPSYDHERRPWDKATPRKAASALPPPPRAPGQREGQTSDPGSLCPQRDLQLPRGLPQENHAPRCRRATGGDLRWLQRRLEHGDKWGGVGTTQPSRRWLAAPLCGRDTSSFLRQAGPCAKCATVSLLQKAPSRLFQVRRGRVPRRRIDLLT